ncbi:phenolic glucoside malonyltransferase 1-like [Ziziphus jujuba]|uniref:Phenolic glucoside malonyltransferase 1-like n=1 Tax=Ziziphus jujuba TaxID=326968 RepID=A0A6P3ZPB7_ZIZJJ|nr:phenolic glucoside malonyltransferase 1-like [Ziziphus jujuba]
MAQSNSIKIVEVCKVSPPTHSPAGPAIPQALPLTFFDLLWLRSPPVQRLFFYQFPVSTATFSDSILPKLKQSLSLTLLHFIPLAGNLIWPQSSHIPLIDYVDGDGVPFTVAESDADFSRLSTAKFCEPTAYHPFIPQLAVSVERAEAMALQVTLFPNHGFSIGIATHHAVVDGKCSTTFMKTWAQICKFGSDQSELKLLYDRSVIKDPKGLEAIYTGQLLEFGGPNNRSLMTNWKPEVPSDSVRGLLELSRSKIEKLREYAKIEMAKKNEPPLHTSTFSITLAYICACLAKSEGISDELQLLVVSFNVDCRTRLEPPIPAYFGNCLTVNAALAGPKGILGKEGFLVALKAIDEAIKKLDDGGILEGAENWVSGKHSLPPFKIYNLAGSPRFGVYGSDFGWGRPIKVDMTSVDSSGAICLSDAKNGDVGVQITLVLKKQLMEIFASQFAKGLEDLPF